MRCRATGPARGRRRRVSRPRTARPGRLGRMPAMRGISRAATNVEEMLFRSRRLASPPASGVVVHISSPTPVVLVDASRRFDDDASHRGGRTDRLAPIAWSGPARHRLKRCALRMNLHGCGRLPCATTGPRLGPGNTERIPPRHCHGRDRRDRGRAALRGRYRGRHPNPMYRPRACVARKPHAATIDTKAARTWSAPASIEPKCSGHFGHSLCSAWVPEICCAISR